MANYSTTRVHGPPTSFKTYGEWRDAALGRGVQGPTPDAPTGSCELFVSALRHEDYDGQVSMWREPVIRLVGSCLLHSDQIDKNIAPQPTQPEQLGGDIQQFLATHDWVTAPKKFLSHEARQYLPVELGGLSIDAEVAVDDLAAFAAFEGLTPELASTSVIRP